MNAKAIATAIVLLAVPGLTQAWTIVERIEQRGAGRVIAPAALLRRLEPVVAAEQPVAVAADGVDDAAAGLRGSQQAAAYAGYRVQVFSDNNARTAKSEASQREAQLNSMYPQYRTYKKYSAPYWRLRVGDFRTEREAEAAAADMRRAFPSFSKEIRVVRDRINHDE